MTTDTRARIHDVWVPLVENWWPRLFRKCPYQLGSPWAMPTTALETDDGVRLSGNRNSTAASDQNPAHTASGVTERPMPWAAADEATPVSSPSPSPSPCTAPASGGVRPGHEAEQPVHEDTAGRAGQRSGRSGENHAEALPEEPHPEGPGERHGQGGTHRRPVEEPQADGELNQREERVPDRDVRREEVPDVGDEVADDERLPLGVGQDVGLHEAAPEHEGLELQGGVEHPEQPQDDLQRPL